MFAEQTPSDEKPVFAEQTPPRGRPVFAEQTTSRGRPVFAEQTPSRGRPVFAEQTTSRGRPVFPSKHPLVEDLCSYLIEQSLVEGVFAVLGQQRLSVDTLIKIGGLDDLLQLSGRGHSGGGLQRPSARAADEREHAEKKREHVLATFCSRGSLYMQE